MSILKPLVSFAAILGSPTNRNILHISKDADGNFVLAVEEDNELGKMRSQGVRIEAFQGDSSQVLVYKAIENLVKAVEESHQKHPNHPSFLVQKNTD